MNHDVVISVEHVSKKRCMSLKRSMLYGIMDIGRNMLGMSSKPELLREGEFWALDDISFEVKRGETLGIIGPNGSGKTTLLKLLNGIFWPDKGKITIRGKVGALIELGAGFHPLLTGRENVYINGAILGMTRREVEAKFDEIVDFADIGDFVDTPVKFYSSGMYLRLGFAVVIHSEPDVLLVDEILAVGDLPFQMKCFGKIRELKKAGKTVVIVTHDMSTIQRHTERVCILYRGSIHGTELPNDAVNQYLELMSRVSKSNKNQDQGKVSQRWDGEGDVKTFQDHLSEWRSEDNCPRRAGYNQKEFRYGSGAARIIDFRIERTNSEESCCIRSGEVFIVRCRVVFVEDVEKPIFGIAVKTKDGIELYGTNSLLRRMEIKERAKGEDIWIEYRLRANLQSGDYFLSLGVAADDGGRVVPLDRRYDLATISVLPGDASFGVVNLDGEIHVGEPG